ncbi:hypothetical protein ACH5RR_011271 [Cinchona calisaya]|uniref:Malectin-like domain-containing protein n=1 Tax=Cinchona calisaya TaxID=153742 RepID=A0ABD3A7U7_9GENT
MSTFVFYLPFLLNLFIVTAADTPAYTPTDHILLNCGTSLNSTLDGRNWMGDNLNKFSPNNLANISSAATATEQHPSVTQVPYLTARIIHSQFSYNFPVSPGKKFLRLYFYPVSYTGGFNKTESFFTVTANNYTLLSNFSAFLAVSAEKPPVAYLVKEFIINIVQDNHFLNVIFLPSSNSYAFVNGIEVVSTPDNLYMGTHDLNNNPLKFVNNLNNLFEFDENKTAFETLYRLNVGGNDVSVKDDTGMFREWRLDDSFLSGGDIGNPLSNDTMIVEYTSQTPNYTAPAIVYTTARAMGKYSDKFNLTWIFSVDSGFLYLLRLHFCEMMPYLINSPNQRVFTIFINNRTAEPQADVILWTGGSGIPIFRDFVVLVPNPTGGRPAKQDLFLALHPAKDANPVYLDAILNGLEIFKLNSSDGSLAGTNPEVVLDPPSPAVNPGSNKKKSGGRSGIHFAVIGGVVGGVAVILILLGFVISRRRRGWKDFDNNSTNTKSSWAPLSTRSRSTRTSASAEKGEGGGRLPFSSLFVMVGTTTEDDTDNEFSESSEEAEAEAALLKSNSLTTSTATSRS